MIRDPSTPWETLQQRPPRPREIDAVEYHRLLLSRRHLEWVWRPRGVLVDRDSGERFVLARHSGRATPERA
jgi:hypothetical protein